MASMTTGRVGSHDVALSIDVEDWFHTDNVRDMFPREAWERCELRVERNTMRMLEILQSSNARATFFVLGWVADKCQQLARAIAAAGHEVASHGYGHEHVYSLQPSELRSDVVRSKRYLEDLTQDSLGWGRLFLAHSLLVVGSGRAYDPALGDALGLLHLPLGDRSRPAARPRHKGDQFASPTRQPSSVRGALRHARRRFRVVADLRSHRRMERRSRYDGSDW
jgi:peptidoglycan/xylan/chitin deacetylase (PgdA/CDA1 family)